MIVLVPLLAAAAAAAYQDTAALDRAVTAFTGRPMGAEGGARTALDPRLRLAACPMVAMSWRTEAKDAVVVTCAGPSWRLFVPVVAAPRAAAAPIAAVAPPRPAAAVIRRGDPVTIEAGADGFSITRDGVAMADAAPGARLPVQVAGATKPVQAVAVDTGRATLPGY